MRAMNLEAKAMVKKQCSATMFDRAVSHDTRCRHNAGHVGHHDDGCLSWEDSPPRTGDVLRDAADDIQSDWPWHADAIRVMHECLKSMAEAPGEMGERATAALKRAEQACEGGPT